MKALGLAGLMLLSLVFFSSCASQNDALTESSTTSTTPVPGEKIPGEGGFGPGGAPGSGNVRW